MEISEQNDTEPQFKSCDRTCLKCGSHFPSEWPGERICKNCKGSGEWKHPSPYQAA